MSATTTTPSATKVFADRIGRIEVSATMAVTAEAAKLRAQGAKLVDFGAGEPHFATPRHIKDAATKAIDENFTRYTVVSGIPELRKAIVARHACDFGSDYSPEETVFTTGGKLALFNAIQVLVDHGDEVILPVPYWVSFKDIIQYAGGKVVFLETEEAENFRITAEAIEKAITPRTKAIILNSPSNPAGSVISPDDLERIVKLAHERGIYLLLDECYVYLQYTGALVSGGSFTEAKDHLVVLGSLSKTYAMTGMARRLRARPQAHHRCDEQTAEPVHVIHFIIRPESCDRGPQQLTGVRGGDARRLPRAARPHPGPLGRNPRRYLHETEGAFYVYPNISAYLGKPGVQTAMELAGRLLHEAHVVTVPGEAFGTQHHIRLSYAVSHDDVEEGLKRMKDFFAKLSA